MDHFLLQSNKCSESESKDASSTSGTSMKKRKYRKYDDSYLDFGFTSTEFRGEDRPQCVLCMKILAQDCMVPSKLKRHLETNHATMVTKSRDYFTEKLRELNQQKGSFTNHASVPSNALLASYKVSHRIAKCKEPHTIAEELILPAALDMVNIMIGESAGEMLSKVLLSNDPISHRMQYISEDLNEKLIDNIKGKEFGLQLDEDKLKNPDGKESASGENGASTSDVDDPVPQRRLVDEVGNSVADTSNQIYIQERNTKDSSLHKLSNCTEYLTNDNIKTEFDNSVSTVRIENNIGDNSILLRSVPTPNGAHLDNSIDKISVKASNVENVHEDEFEAFGKYVAMALRKMPMSNALSVENQIFSAINKERRLILLQNDQSGINIGVGVKMEIEDEPI